MGSIRPQPDTEAAYFGSRPKCPICAVPMWLVRVLKHVSEDPNRTRLQYECVVCDTTAILPPLDD
jgi:hypothetical protein